MEQRRREEEKFIREQNEFYAQASRPHNFAEKANSDMYGANNGMSYGGGGSSLAAGGGGVSYGAVGGGASFGAGGGGTSYAPAPAVQAQANTSQSLNFSTTDFQANSHGRPPVVSSGGCCCNIM